MPKFYCKIDNCDREFSRKYSLNRHISSHHSASSESQEIYEKCYICGQILKNSDISSHFSQFHKPSRKFQVKESAFNKKFITYRYTFLENEIDFVNAQRNIKDLIVKQILYESSLKHVCKISLIFIAEMVMHDTSGEQISTAAIPFRGPSFLANPNMKNLISKNVNKTFQHQQNSLEEFINSGSNWVFRRALTFDIEIASFKAIRAGGQKDLISTPFRLLKNFRHLFNPQTFTKCFLYCIAAFLLLRKNIKIDNLSIRKTIKKFNVANIEFPIEVSKIKKFLNQNKHLNLRVNILSIEKKSNGFEQIYPIQYGVGSGKRTVNLLLVQLQDGHHFMLVKDLDKYLRNVYKSEKTNKLSYQKGFFCANCLNCFYTEKNRTEHERFCLINKPRLERVPEKHESNICFKNYERTHMLDYIAFADFECILPDISSVCSECNSLKCKCDRSHTDKISKQIPIAYSFVVLGSKNNIIHEHSYIGKNAHLNFVSHLLEQEELWLSELLNSKNAMIFTDDDKMLYKSATHCYLCNAEFSDSVLKCKDHCHFSQKFLGAACSPCNLRRRKQSRLKIFIHNGSRFDFHFIIQALSKTSEDISNINVLPFNSEHFRTLSFNSFEFIDSLAFLQSSLANLSEDLKNSNHSYPILKQTYLVKTGRNIDKDKFALVLKKSFFPYEFCSSYKLMKKTTKIPKMKHFYSSLSEKTISKDDHKFATTVWKNLSVKIY